MIFGSGVAGLLVLTHTHTLPMILLFIPHTDIFLAPRVAKHPHIAISHPPSSCSPSRTSNCLLIVFTHRNFPGFTHAIFPLRIGEWCGSILCSEVDLWVLHCDCSRTGRDTVNSSPSVVCVRFSSAALIVKNGLLSSPCMLVMYVDYILELFFFHVVDRGCFYALRLLQTV